ncbi:MAG: HD domain-containing protein [Armatimonadetes bacterium]|nr:HD domain-containing protein [Armatimonadota bacterium]
MRILVVSEDLSISESLMANMALDNFDVLAAASEISGMSIGLVAPLDLVVVDYQLIQPKFIEKLRSASNLQGVPILVLSKVDDIGAISRCLRAGADDYLIKPVHPVVLCARVLTLLDRRKKTDRDIRKKEKIERENSRLRIKWEQEKRKTESAELSTIFAMCKLAESRDPETGEHLERMQEYSHILALQLADDGSFDEIDSTFIDLVHGASPLHDIGKVAIPDHVLLKPGRLTDEERGIMQTHTEVGADTLRAVHKLHPTNAFVEMGIEIAESHHEWWDGSGYPHKKKGHEIPLAARIVAVADVYDALTSARCYKDEFSHQRAADIIFSESGTHFDPRVVNSFFRAEHQIKAIRGPVTLALVQAG